MTKAPPKNLDKPEQERLPREVPIIAEAIGSEESAAWGKMQSAPIDIDQYEYATGVQIRMRNAIVE